MDVSDLLFQHVVVSQQVKARQRLDSHVQFVLNPASLWSGRIDHPYLACLVT